MDSFFAGKKIFVTGGAGFIGANLVRRLLREGADVSVLMRASTDPWRLRGIGNFSLFVFDVADFARMDSVLSKLKPDGIFHLAASMMVQGKILEPDKIKIVNITALENMLDLIPDNCFFINTGTFSDGELDEFNQSKLWGTKICGDFGKKNKMPVVTLRVFTPYGPYIQKERFVFNALAACVHNEEIIIEKPSVARDFIFVDDLIDLYFAAAEKSYENCGEIFDAGSGVSTTLKEAAKTALLAADSASNIVLGEGQRLSYDSEHIQADIKKNKERLGWIPKTSLCDGFKNTYGWLKENLNKY